MISFTLAKNLKDSGFSQEPFWVNDDVVCWGGSWYLLVKPEACAMPVFADPDDYKKGIELGDDLVKIPTLEELIKECEKELQKRFWKKWFKFESSLQDDFFYKAECAGITMPIEEGGKDETFEAIGKTPEEAVSNLWLKLK